MIERARYPLLFQEQEAIFAIGPMRFVFELEPPIPALVSNVRIAAFSGDQVLLIDTREFGISAFPGGTLEPEEDWRAVGRSGSASPVS